MRTKLTTRLAALALAAVVAIAALGATALSQDPPPFRYYGEGSSADDAAAGDTVTVVDADGAELGSATVASDGTWYIDVARDDAAGVSFQINGMGADADITNTGAGQAAVVLTKMPPPPPEPEPEPVEEPVCPDDGMMSDDSLEGDDDSMMEEDSMESDDSMMSDDDDAMLDCPEEGDEDDGTMDDAASDDGIADEDDDGMMDDDADDAMLDEDVGMPATGTGGLADGGISAGLIGLLIALGAAAVAGLGIRRVRNRA